MPTFFSTDPTYPTRAQQIWQILVGAAHRREIMTYAQLSDLLGIKVIVNTIPSLGHIMFWCDQNHLPPLTLLVVSQESGKPGPGLHLEDVDKAREAVFGYNWYDVVPPTVEELADAYKKGSAKD